MIKAIKSFSTNSFIAKWYTRKLLSSLFIITIALTCSSTYSTMDFTKIDLSVTPSFNLSTNQRIFLISYAQGEAYERNQNYLAQSAINKGIDTIISYRKQHYSKEFYENNKKLLDGNHRRSGWYIFKPYFILETLKMMSPNDILIYVDVGAYLTDSVEPILEMINKPDTSMLLFENRHTNRSFIKRDTFDIMEVDYKHRDDIQLETGFLVIKKTPLACNFMEKWLHYCCIERAVTDLPSQAPEFEDFVSHRHDQAILSLLCIKYPNPGIKLVRRHGKAAPERIDIFYLHRRRDANEPMITKDRT